MSGFSSRHSLPKKHNSRQNCVPAADSRLERMAPARIALGSRANSLSGDCAGHFIRCMAGSDAIDLV